MDRVSNLPDEVLCHILSFLPTKHAALTSVLSKRWRNLLAFVPNLDIEDSVFLHPEEGKRERDGILQGFMDFVDRVLALQGNSTIDKVSIKCKTGVHEERVNLWIHNVLQRGVSNLDLFIEYGDGDDYFLPLDMFFSKKLVELKLRSDCGLHWCAGGEGTLLPILKTLVIDLARFCCDKIETFLIAFPVLEELYMAYIEWADPNETVSSASLRKLTIYARGSLNPTSISFDAPSLVYLNYSDYVAEDYPKVNLANLVEARINIALTYNQIMRARAPNNDEDDVFLRFGNAWKLMNGIRNVQKLLLSPNTLEVLSLCTASIPVFNNLRVLTIMSDAKQGWQVMPVLLRNCPQLETLTIQGLLHSATDKCGDACDCISREDKGRSLISCPVKSIRIKGFRETVRELQMIEHFLYYFPCLKVMEIYAAENSPTVFNPEKFGLIVKTIKLYDLLYTCDVQFLVRRSLDRKWTAQ